MGTQVGFIKSWPSLYSCLLHCVVAIMCNNTVDYKYFFVLSGSAKVTSWTVWQRNRRRRRRKRRRSWRSSWRYFTKINKEMNKNGSTTNFITWPEASLFSAVFQPRALYFLLSSCRTKVNLSGASRTSWRSSAPLTTWKSCWSQTARRSRLENPMWESWPDWEIQHVI